MQNLCTVCIRIRGDYKLNMTVRSFSTLFRMFSEIISLTGPTGKTQRATPVNSEHIELSRTHFQRHKMMIIMIIINMKSHCKYNRAKNKASQEMKPEDDFILPLVVAIFPYLYSHYGKFVFSTTK